MILWLIACTAPEGTDPVDPPPATIEDTDSDVVVDLDTGDTGAPTTDLYRPEQLNCTDIPPLPTEFTDINGIGPHEDFTFDTNGNLVGVDGGGNLRASPRDGSPTLLSPNVGSAKGTRFLLDGSVVVALPDQGTVDIIHPTGGQTTLTSTNGANGIAIDLHGYVWAATSAGHIERIDANGDRLIAAEVNGTLDGITFSPDFRTLYFNSEFGNIRKLEIDDDGNPVGNMQPFASVPVLFAVLDGMTTDMCGNLYVARMDGRVYRFLPDGTGDGFINISAHPGIEVIPAVNFGSGMGGFDRDKLYAMNFLGGVIEADIGIEGRWEPHFPVPQQ